MKLTIDSFHPQQRFGEKEGLKMIKDAGFDGVDYTFCGLPDDHPFFGESSGEYARQMREYLDLIGLPVVQAHAPFDLAYEEPFDLSCRNYAKIVRALEAAALLGAPCIVVHAVTVRDRSADFIEDYNYEFYRTLEPYAEKYGIRIAVENLFNTDRKRKSYSNRRCGTPELVNRMLARLDSDWFTVCLDLGHAAMTGFEPEEFLRGVIPGAVTALHVQDTDYLADRHQLPFICDLNWPEIMTALGETGYSGTFNYELCHYLAKFPSELYPSALKMAHDVGRYLIALSDEA